MTDHRASADGVEDLRSPGLHPRTGAGREVVATVAQAGPERIIHIGCDPATFSRDIASWRESGYRPTRMALVNAFPGTHHFEVIAQLER